MRVEQLNEEMWAMTYLIVCEETKLATLIDPVWDNLSDYLSLLEEEGLSLSYAMATHTHADHITGCFQLAEMTDCEYVMWNDTPSLGVTIYVDEETSISMGNIDFHFHHSPGHTGDSMIIECGDYIFTGDFLFTGEGELVVMTYQAAGLIYTGKHWMFWKDLVVKCWFAQVMIHQVQKCKQWHGTEKITTF